MTRLPRALEPWARELEGLPLELSTALSPWLQRITAALGPLRVRTRGDSGNVDGYEGIGRRGSFERMLLSDWLLANDLPDEFLRRVSEGELSYLQFAFEAERGSLRSIVLFDSGPDQIGAPRLAHLALFIVLSRRASSAGAEFAWGVQQDPEGGLHAEVGPGALQQLLNTRTADPVTSGHLDAWLRSLAALAVPAEREVWRIGPAAFGGVDRHARLGPRIEVEDGPGGAAAAVSLSIADGNLGRPPLILKLPPRAESIRLLRDPYRVRRVARTSASGSDQTVVSWFLSAGSRRLLTHHADGGVRAYHIPDLPQQQRGGSVRVPGRDDETVVCAQFAKRRLLVVTSDGTRLRVRTRTTEQQHTLPIQWVEPDPSAPIRPCWLRRRRSTGTSSITFTDGANTLYRLPWATAGAQPSKLLEDVVATLQVDGVLRCVALVDGGLIEYREHLAGDGFRQHAACRVPAGVEPTDTAGEHPKPWLAAAPMGRTAALMRGDSGHLYFDGLSQRLLPVGLPDGATPFGLVGGSQRPSVVALKRDGITIAAIDPLNGAVGRELEAVGVVETLWCSPTDRLIGYMTDRHEVLVVNLADGEVRAHFADSVLGE